MKIELELLLIWMLNALALLAVANFVPGIHVDGFGAALIAAFFLGLVNTAGHVGIVHFRDQRHAFLAGWFGAAGFCRG